MEGPNGEVEMDDRLAAVERNLAELQKGIADVRQDVVNRIEQGYRWTIITMAVGLIITWLGVFLLLSRGTSLLKKILMS